MINAPPAPSPMPMMPPSTQSTTASMRNCSRMLNRVAPSALRMPISRVRSVTDTSMMFMMPMPPTSSDTAAMPDSRYVMTSRRLLRRRQDVGLIADLEIVRRALPNPVLAAKHALNVGHRVRDLVFALGERADRLETIGAVHAEARRVDRNEDLIVRILERVCLALRREHADDGELRAANAHAVRRSALPAW